MVDELDQQSVRISKIEGPGPVTVGLGLRRQYDSLSAYSVSPGVYVLRTPNHETDMMQRLPRSRLAVPRQLMQSQVVLTGTEIGVFLVGHPFQFHAENIRVELQRLTHIPDVQSHVAEAHKQGVH